MTTTTLNLIAVAKLDSDELLYLYKINPKLYQWSDTEIKAETVEEAIRLAFSHWKKEGFRLIPCGYVFTLPERDEHGNNALFYQMAKSLDSSNGIYFDEVLGHNCIVQQIPLETKGIYEAIKSQIATK